MQSANKKAPTVRQGLGWQNAAGLDRCQSIASRLLNRPTFRRALPRSEGASGGPLFSTLRPKNRPTGALRIRCTARKQ